MSCVFFSFLFLVCVLKFRGFIFLFRVCVFLSSLKKCKISSYFIFSSAPAARMAMTRRVRPLVSLNPYQGNWTIKVSVTSKGNMRNYKNARGDGCVFNVELTDEDVRIVVYLFWNVNVVLLVMCGG